MLNITVELEYDPDPTTEEPCPVCQAPARCQHGHFENGKPVHIWTCRECGPSLAHVCYDCPVCRTNPV
jgi:hypothetical protein